MSITSSSRSSFTGWASIAKPVGVANRLVSKKAYSVGRDIIDQMSRPASVSGLRTGLGLSRLIHFLGQPRPRTRLTDQSSKKAAVKPRTPRFDRALGRGVPWISWSPRRHARDPEPAKRSKVRLVRAGNAQEVETSFLLAHPGQRRCDRMPSDCQRPQEPVPIVSGDHSPSGGHG
jgi:hypothetical protein